MKPVKTNTEISKTIESNIKDAKSFYQNQLSSKTKSDYSVDLQNGKQTGYFDYLSITNIEEPANNADAEKVISLYLPFLVSERLSVSTIERRLSGIAKYFSTIGLASPFTFEKVQGILKGIKREKGVRQNQAKAIRYNDMILAIDKINGSQVFKDLRDKAILLLGYAGMFRRSELVALKVSDLNFTNNGLEVLVRKSKTDQLGEGQTKVIPVASDTRYCAVTALKDYLTTCGIESGFVFRSIGKGSKVKDNGLAGIAVNRVVKKWIGEDYSGHSLRVGMAVEHREKGVNQNYTISLAGWKADTMYRHYTKDVDQWKESKSIF